MTASSASCPTCWCGLATRRLAPEVDQDVPGNTGLKFLYYFDPLTAETGCLRVVPGSHLELDRNEVGDVEPVRRASGNTGLKFLYYFDPLTRRPAPARRRAPGAGSK